jgi:CheY-like chemotaxis protein
MKPHSTALVLEDNKHMQTMLKEMLRAMAVESVDAVPTVAQARAHLDLLQYDIAIVDVALEDDNGLDFVASIRADPNHPARRMPMIVVSGQNQMSAIARARDAGADAFLAKPVSPALLGLRVQQVLTSPRTYVEAPYYFGPDRRRDISRLYSGPERRRTEWLI